MGGECPSRSDPGPDHTRTHGVTRYRTDPVTGFPSLRWHNMAISYTLVMGLACNAITLSSWLYELSMRRVSGVLLDLGLLTAAVTA